VKALEQPQGVARHRVGVARIADVIGVSVGLRLVGDLRAHIACVAEAIGVLVALLGVRGVATVVADVGNAVAIAVFRRDDRRVGGQRSGQYALAGGTRLAVRAQAARRARHLSRDRRRVARGDEQQANKATSTAAASLRCRPRCR